MRWDLFFSLALLFLTSGAPANAQSEQGHEPAPQFVELAAPLYYDIGRNLTINCSVSSADKTLGYTWMKNGKLVEEVAELKGRYKTEGATFALTARATEDDYGNYSCALGADDSVWDVRPRPLVRLPDNSNVVEGQKLKLQCKVLGKPAPTVTWFYKAAEDGNSSLELVAGARGGRVSFEPNEQQVPGAALVLAQAERDDAGFYTCQAAAAGLPPVGDHTQLRVKDMYAALWPFLGICAEVFVLCAIILVYEKRRTKPELDDSDTDNHDQKKS